MNINDMWVWQGRVDQFMRGVEGIGGEPQETEAPILHINYIYRRSVGNAPWQFIPKRDCTHPEDLLATSGFILLLVNLERMAVTPRTGGGGEIFHPMEHWEGRVLLCPYRLGYHGVSYGLRGRGAACPELTSKGIRLHATGRLVSIHWMKSATKVVYARK